MDVWKTLLTVQFLSDVHTKFSLAEHLCVEMRCQRYRCDGVLEGFSPFPSD
jgi:hypothetical protein